MRLDNDTLFIDKINKNIRGESCNNLIIWYELIFHKEWNSYFHEIFPVLKKEGHIWVLYPNKLEKYVPSSIF